MTRTFSRLDWWAGVLLVSAALLTHALLPRYSYQHPGNELSGLVWTKVDRWTGRAYLVRVTATGEVPQ